MATAVQFLSNPKLQAPVLVVSGRNQELRRRVIAAARERVRPQFYFPFEPATKPKLVVSTCGQYHDAMVVHWGVDLDDWGMYDHYSQYPVQNVTLVLDTVRSKDEERKRILTGETVMNVDCTPWSEELLTAICQKVYKLPQEDTSWLLGQVVVDGQMAMRALDLIGVWEDYQPGLIREVWPFKSQVSAKLNSLRVMDTTDAGVLRQVKLRAIQLVQIADGLHRKLSMEEITKAANTDRFVAAILLKLAKQYKPGVWLDMLAAAIKLEQYLDQPGFRERLDLIIP